jgi:glycosyltransferase involved in cell wall biosynthesis
MKLSIIIPTFNNLNYLKLFLSSIKNNSSFEHEIILHINEGSDGTLEYAKKKILNLVLV